MHLFYACGSNTSYELPEWALAADLETTPYQWQMILSSPIPPTASTLVTTLVVDRNRAATVSVHDPQPMTYTLRSVEFSRDESVHAGNREADG